MQFYPNLKMLLDNNDWTGATLLYDRHECKNVGQNSLQEPYVGSLRFRKSLSFVSL